MHDFKMVADLERGLAIVAPRHDLTVALDDGHGVIRISGNHCGDPGSGSGGHQWK